MALQIHEYHVLKTSKAAYIVSTADIHHRTNKSVSSQAYTAGDFHSAHAIMSSCVKKQTANVNITYQNGRVSWLFLCDT